MGGGGLGCALMWFRSVLLQNEFGKFWLFREALCWHITNPPLTNAQSILENSSLQRNIWSAIARWKLQVVIEMIKT